MQSENVETLNEKITQYQRKDRYKSNLRVKYV